MRTLVVTQFISADGVVEAPGGESGYPHSGWVGGFFSDELGAYKQEEQLSAEVLLLGRTTYEGFHGAWPDRDGPMADKINTMRKVVVSTTLGSSDWAATEVVTDLEGVRALKQEDGGPILVAGSATLVHGLLAEGLVDRIALQVFPVALCSGARLWPESPDTLGLELVGSRAVANGVLLLSYAVR